MYLLVHLTAPEDIRISIHSTKILFAQRMILRRKNHLAFFLCQIVLGSSLVSCFQICEISRKRIDIESKTRWSLFAEPAGVGKIAVAVTREDGKNEKLIRKIKETEGLSDHVEIFELPCIAHASGEDYDILSSTLLQQEWDYVAVTSPEAAKVLASAWEDTGKSQASVVAVGKATEMALEKFGISVSFVPSKANAETLAAELETKWSRTTTLLYPASAKANDTLQSGLEARGFKVTRLNTYDTVTASWTESQKNIAKTVKVACFASPSSIKGWLLNTDDNKDVIAACIGETSATACRGHSWNEEQIYFAEKPGIDGWVDAIQNAVLDVKNVAHAP